VNLERLVNGTQDKEGESRTHGNFTLRAFLRLLENSESRHIVGHLALLSLPLGAGHILVPWNTVNKALFCTTTMTLDNWLFVCNGTPTSVYIRVGRPGTIDD
jgi:hypothetical protein